MHLSTRYLYLSNRRMMYTENTFSSFWHSHLSPVYGHPPHAGTLLLGHPSMSSSWLEYPEACLVSLPLRVFRPYSWWALPHGFPAAGSHSGCSPKICKKDTFLFFKVPWRLTFLCLSTNKASSVFLMKYLGHYSPSELPVHLGKLWKSYFAAELNRMRGEIRCSFTASTVSVPVLGWTSLQPLVVRTGK